MPNRPRYSRNDLSMIALMICVFLVGGTGTVFAVIANGKQDSATAKAQRAEDKANQQQAGRRVAVGVLCAYANGVSAAGRVAIARGGVAGDRVQHYRSGLIRRIVPGELNRYLQRHGYGTPTQQAVRANAAARAYGSALAERVAATAGADARSVVRPDGSIDCRALARASAVAP